MHDLVIKNAQIVDGARNPPKRGSVAVDKGRISAIGSDVGQGAHTVDAAGLALMPGIIDTHTHYDAQITWDPGLTPSPALGVTTAIIGNCGFTIAPCRAHDRDLTMRNLMKVEGMSLDAMRAGIRWDFETVPEYFDMIERRGTVANVAAFVGHSSVRTYVMGDDAPLRAATPSQIKAMKSIVLDAMRNGAIGFSTSTSPSHNAASGDPMPSRLADDDELTALASAVGEAGHGVFMLTKGADTSIAFLESIAAATHRPVVIAALLHNSTQPDAVFDDLAEMQAAAERGRQLYGQVSCCPLTAEFSLRAPYPLEGIASWKPAMRATDDDQLSAIYADAGFRVGVKRDLEEAIAVRLFNGEWEKVSVVEVALDEHRHLEGRHLDDIAQEMDKHPLDCLLDIALKENLETIFTALLLNSDEHAVARLLNHERSSIALSDAGAHLTFFCDAGFGLHLLGHWVRDRRAMSLETAVAELTSRQADIFGIQDRGRIAPGMWADLLLFDPQTVGRGKAHRVFDLPSGARRLTTDANGVHGVWVNGQRIVDAEGMCAHDERPGRFLRKFT